MKGIDVHAFDGCSALMTIRMNAAQPDDIKIPEEIFKSVNTDECKFRVPAGTEERYRSHPIFGQFKNIIPEDAK